MIEILDQFRLDGHAVSCEPFGNGHINHTCLVLTDTGHKYILQKINDSIFRDVAGLMHNIDAVTSYLRNQDLGEYVALSLIPTFDGSLYVRWTDGKYYRVYDYVENSVCLDRVETVDDFKQSGVAFGTFQRQLADFPADTLVETIPHFHDTVDRMRQFHEALDADVMGRAKDCKEEIDFVLSHEYLAGSMLDMLKEGKLPLRVTHNDTKLNNVMLNAATRRPMCIIDLDTVMPGLAGNDFGDSIRYGASTAAEDEQDLSKVEMSLDLFRAYAEGFLGACGSSLTPAEIDTLPLSSVLMTFECGSRFLADHLAGDVYFRIHRPNHNLDRCRTQFKLVADMLNKMDAMLDIVHNI